jgi:nucleoside-diphosphate-sugar epimerase
MNHEANADRKPCVIAVLGAKGRLSRCVAETALGAGHQVIAITRNGKLPAGLAGAEPRAADAMDRDALIAATKGADVIFNGLNPPYTAWQTSCMTLAHNVVAAAETHGAHHLFAGNVYNYGVEIPSLAGPETPQHGSTRKGAIRIAMEQVFAEAAGRSVPTTMLRAGDFYGGNGTGSWFDLMIAAKLAKGVLTYPGNPDIAHAWAYLPDLARAFVGLAERRADLIGFRTFTFAGHTLTGVQLQRHAEAALGRSLKRASLPWWLLRAGGLVVPMWREIAEMRYLWFTPHALDGEALEAFLGAVPQTPVRVAVAAALAELGHSSVGA